MKKTIKQRFGAAAATLAMIFTTPFQALDAFAAENTDSSRTLEGVPGFTVYDDGITISGYPLGTGRGRATDKNGEEIEKMTYCLDFKNSMPTSTNEGIYYKGLLSELNEYTKDHKTASDPTHDPGKRTLTDRAKARLLKVILRSGDIDKFMEGPEMTARKESLKKYITDNIRVPYDEKEGEPIKFQYTNYIGSSEAKGLDLKEVKEKAETKFEQEWIPYTNEVNFTQKLVWVLVHDESEWEYLVKDDNSLSGKEDVYHWLEGSFYYSDDPLRDTHSLWNTVFDPVIDYIDSMPDYFEQGYDAWVYVNTEDNFQNMLGTPFRRVRITKTDENGKAVSGAKFMILGAEIENSEPRIDEWESDGSFHMFIEPKPGVEYTITETEAPEGFVKGSDIKFKVDGEGALYVNGVKQDSFDINIVNYVSELHISKRDITADEELPGAKLEIYKASDIDREGKVSENAEPIDSWTSGTDEHIIHGKLEIGTDYVLRETTAPTYYYEVTDTVFNLDESGLPVLKSADSAQVYAESEDITQSNGTVKTIGRIIVNNKKYTPVTVDSPKIQKTITGAPTPSDKDFYFGVVAVNGTTPLPENPHITIRGAGEGSFGKITFTLPGEYNYNIGEYPGEEEGYTYCPYYYAVKYVITREGDKLVSDGGQMIKITPEESSTGDPEPLLPVLEFVNTYNPTPADYEFPIAVKKINGTVPAESDKTFTFEIKAGESPYTNYLPMPYDTKVFVNGSGQSKSFGKVVYGMSGVYTYTISECGLDDSHKGYSKDDSVYTLTVTVTDAGGHLAAEGKLTKNGEPATELEFINEYKALSLNAPFEIEKVFSNGQPTETFSFKLESASGNIETQTVSITGVGKASFKGVEYTEPGVYTYTISEIPGGSSDIKYDQTVYTIEDTVTDNGGQLELSRKITANDIEYTTIVFENSYLKVRNSAGGSSESTAEGSNTADSDNGGDNGGSGGDNGGSEGGSDGNSEGGDNGGSEGGSDGNTGSGDNGGSEGGSDGNTDGGDNGSSEGGSDGNTGSDDNGGSNGGSDGNTGSGDNGGSNGGSDGSTGSGDNGGSEGGSDANTGDSGSTGSDNPATGKAGMIGMSALAICAAAIFVRKRSK